MIVSLQQEVQTGKMALVATAYEPSKRSKDNPFNTSMGEALKIVNRTSTEWPGWVLCEKTTGKQAWVPERMLVINGDNAVIQENYDAHELTAMEGEIMRIEKVESGWAWATSMTDETGWIPLRNLKLIE